MAKCAQCGCPVEAKPRAGHVKCPACRITPEKGSSSLTERNTNQCGVCLRWYKVVSRTHVEKVHNIPLDQYTLQYTEYPRYAPGRTQTEATKAKQSAAATKRWSSESARKAQSEKLKANAPWTGKHLSAEHKEAISDGGTGVSHNLTEAYRKELGVRGAKQLAQMRDDPAIRAKYKAATIRRYQTEPLVGFKNPETVRKSIASRVANGTLTPPGGGRGITGFRQGIPHYCRSTLEANFARILQLEGVGYAYEPQVFTLASGVHWTPDFFLQTPLAGGLVPQGWVELKGWSFADGTLPTRVSDNIAMFEAQGNGGVFVLVQSSPLWQQLERTYRDRIPLWESPTRNLRTRPDIFGSNKPCH